MSENSLYTVEAFREYFEHLKPDGMVAITRWEFQQPREALRVVSVAMQALHEMGVANPAGNFIEFPKGIWTRTEFQSSSWPSALPSRRRN